MWEESCRLVFWNLGRECPHGRGRDNYNLRPRCFFIFGDFISAEFNAAFAPPVSLSRTPMAFVVIGIDIPDFINDGPFHLPPGKAAVKLVRQPHKDALIRPAMTMRTVRRIIIVRSMRDFVQKRFNGGVRLQHNRPTAPKKTRARPRRANLFHIPHQAEPRNTGAPRPMGYPHRLRRSQIPRPPPDSTGQLPQCVGEFG